MKTGDEALEWLRTEMVVGHVMTDDGPVEVRSFEELVAALGKTAQFREQANAGVQDFFERYRKESLFAPFVKPRPLPPGD